MIGFGLSQKSSANRELKKAIDNGKYVHAYLIVGEKGVGKRSFARFAAAKFICGHDLCGCADCKNVVAGHHPDIFVVAPTGKQILIEQIREIISEAAVGVYQAKHKVFIIEQADRMNPAAQNCLLKSLEEPPKGVIFILTAESTKGVLPTVLSRCQVLRMEPTPIQELTDELMSKHSIPRDEAERLARNSRGNMLRAEQLMGNSEYWQQRDSAISAIDAIIDKDAYRASSILCQYKDNVEAILEQLSLWIRDLSLYTLGNSELVINKDKMDELGRQQSRTDISRLYKMLSAVSAAQGRLKRNTSAVSVIDGLALEMMEE